MLFFYCICVIIFGRNVYAFQSNKVLEGYPNAYVGECPGSMKPVTIARDRQKFIEIYVSGVNSPPRTRQKYNYDTTELIAKDNNIDWSKPTLFYIPGWIENVNLPILNNGAAIEVAYKKRGYNVWILNVFTFITDEYPRAARAVTAIGDYVGEMLANLTVIQPKFDHKKLELLGLGLGGQTMSFIAKSFTKRTGVKIAKLTALDPAGPCFRNRGPESRIDDSDADFVEIIMTNTLRFGMAAPAGHVNFYVNGGELQPGHIYWMICGSVCSHERAMSIWLSALKNPSSFIAIKCDTVQEAKQRNCYGKSPLVTNLLGPNVDRTKTGIFFLSTVYYYPYYLGKKGLMKKHDFVMDQLNNINARDVLMF